MSTFYCYTISDVDLAKSGVLEKLCYCISNPLLAITVPPKDPDDLVEIVERLSKTEGREETLALLRALQKALR